MPVTIQVASVVPGENEYRAAVLRGANLTKEQALKIVWSAKGIECKEILQSSFEIGSNYIPNRNGFVKTVIEAYSQHRHLVIRPDDIWIAILGQLNLYVNAHAEEMRSFFVEHEGQKELVVEAAGNRYTVDFGKLTQSMSQQLKENIKDPLLHDWIMPSFSTTTESDKVICSVMMMSVLKSYFGYTMRLRCGIPSITLLGEKSDYESLLSRLIKLSTFGQEPHALSRLLTPILTHFVNVFEVPPVPEFWNTICHYKSGSGGTYIGGWISAFCPWNSEGTWLGHDIKTVDRPLTAEEESFATSYETMDKEERALHPFPILFLDGLRYPVIDTAKIADCFCQVDVKLDDNGEIFDCIMVAGHVGYVERDDLEPDAATGVVKKHTLQPSPQWFLFIKGEAKKGARPFWPYGTTL